MVNTALTLIQGIINAILKALKGDWSGAWNAIKETFVAIWEDIKTWFNGVPAQMLAAGKATIDGLVKGLVDNAGQVVAALSKIITDAITSIKNTLGIHSPSSVFAGIGGNMVAGLVNSLIGGQGAVSDALGGLLGTGGMSLGLNVAGAGMGYGGSYGAGTATATPARAAQPVHIHNHLYLDGRELKGAFADAIYDAVANGG